MNGTETYTLEQAEDHLATLRGQMGKLTEIYDAGGNTVQVNGFWVATDPVNGGPETWHTIPALQNSWADRNGSDATYPVSSYRLLPENDVEMNLHLVAGTIANGTLLFTMPNSYIPAHTQIMPLACDGTSAFGPGTPTLLIRGSGAVNPGQVLLFNAPTGTTRIHNSSARYSKTL